VLLDGKNAVIYGAGGPDLASRGPLHDQAAIRGDSDVRRLRVQVAFGALEFLRRSLACGRAATLADVGNVAAFAASDQARTITASAINITCGSVAG
jgi:enoyl-[acyl-carrier-protein] reductase (NADH)